MGKWTAKLNCGNCGHTWDEEFLTGIALVRDDKDPVDSGLMPRDECSFSSDTPREDLSIEHIECPVCKTYSFVCNISNNKELW